MEKSTKVGLTATILSTAAGFGAAKLVKAKPMETTLQAGLGYTGGSSPAGFALALPQFNPGDTVEATLEVTNTGSVTARNVAATVEIKNPDGSTWLKWTPSLGDIEPGKSATSSKSKKVEQTGTYTHSGTATADNAPDTTFSGDAFEVVAARTTIQLEIFPDKTQYERGETVHYGCRIRNTGDNTAKRAYAFVTLYEPDGDRFKWWSPFPGFPTDIEPGKAVSSTDTVAIPSTAELGTYTEEGSAKADNAPTDSISKRKSFDVVRTGTTVQAGMSYKEVTAGAGLRRRTQGY